MSADPSPLVLTVYLRLSLQFVSALSAYCVAVRRGDCDRATFDYVRAADARRRLNCEALQGVMDRPTAERLRAAIDRLWQATTDHFVTLQTLDSDDPPPVEPIQKALAELSRVWPHLRKGASNAVALTAASDART